MELLAISLSGLKSVQYQGRMVETGIYKQAVEGSVQVTKMGLEGDFQADLENHGGEDKAVYVYSVENHEFWQHELQSEWPFGQFGENFTVTGMQDDRIHIGDVFQIGTAIFQVTQPRVPCFKLGIKMKDPLFVGRFHTSGRVGFYLRVLQTGEVKASDAIRLIEADAHRMTIQEAMLALSKGERQQEVIAKVLAIPALSQAWRESLERKRV